MNIFISGTDTNVGKTVVTAGIAAVMQGLGYSAGVYKPVQTGAIKQENRIISPDLRFIESIDSNILTKSTYNFLYPAAPALAALMEGVKININNFSRDYKELSRKCDFVLAEGAGGLLTPVYNDFLIRDLIKLLNLPLLIVARPDIGTINHTLLTIEAAKSSGIKIIGVIISNFPENTENMAIKTAPKIISDLSGVNILGVLPSISEINPEILIDAIINNLDLQEIFKLKIPKLSTNI